ncbi:MAG TPA: hypothetical protein VF221_07960, partial [Chloroflexota bacterium]
MKDALERIKDERPVAQLREQTGRMLELGSEDGVPKLDWVEGVARLLANDSWLEEVEREIEAIHASGIRHIIWSGMGGSIMTVRVLLDMGLLHGESDSIAVHPLDSTDPAALNDIVRALAAAKDISLPASGVSAPQSLLRELLSDVMMIGVSMGMTSEEPITHLEWFTDLLAQAGLPIDRHCLVMTLHGSYLERFAQERGFPARPLQLDGGTGTGGRMSAPTTRVFLLPAAIALRSASPVEGQLRPVLRQGWEQYDLEQATDRPETHLYVRLAATLSDAAIDGACRLSFSAGERWSALFPGIEQLMEESLGKSGKGVILFEDAPLDPRGRCYRSDGSVRVHVGRESGSLAPDTFTLAPAAGENPADLLAALAASFLGWQLAMALYGYLHDTPFAGQPAVEAYKARARQLRGEGEPLQAGLASAQVLREGPLTLLVPPDSTREESPLSAMAAALTEACPPYLDLTVNGKLRAEELRGVRSRLAALANRTLGVPAKLRIAPAAYHSTEQSEMDGPPGLVSLRVLALNHEDAVLGSYTDTFLAAQ